MQILPRIRNRFGESIGVELFLQPPDLNENDVTFISTDAASGVSSFTVEDGSKFAANEYVVVGNIGAEKTEIIKLSSASSTSLSLAATSAYPHNRGTRIISIPYNQAIIGRSTDAGVSYSDLATIDLRLDSTETYYNHTTGASTDYYRVKFYNSTTALSSSNSDGIIATGYAVNSAGEIIRRALISLGEKIDGNVLTKEFLLEALHDGRQEIDRHILIDRWSFRTVFDYNAGNMIPGRYQITLPTDLRDDDTFKNILALYLGKNKRELYKIDKRAINNWYRGVAHSTLDGAITSASTSIVLTSSGDFDESGTVDIAAESVSGTVDNAAYTSNTESTNTLGTVTSIADSHADDRDVWQGASFGLPTEYTVYESKITFSQPFSDDYAGENIFIDYYQKLTKADSDGDLLDEPWAEIYVPYMRFRIKKRKNSQIDRKADPDFQELEERKEANVRKEFTGQSLRLSVDVPDNR